MQVSQIAQKPKAKWDAIRQQVHPRFTSSGFLFRFVHAFGCEVGKDFTGVQYIGCNLPSEENHEESNDAPDDCAPAKSNQNNLLGLTKRVVGAHPGAKPHLHFNISRPHAPNCINGEDKGET